MILAKKENAIKNIFKLKVPKRTTSVFAYLYFYTPALFLTTSFLSFFLVGESVENFLLLLIPILLIQLPKAVYEYHIADRKPIEDIDGTLIYFEDKSWEKITNKEEKGLYLISLFSMFVVYGIIIVTRIFFTNPDIFFMLALHIFMGVIALLVIKRFIENS